MGDVDDRVHDEPMSESSLTGTRSEILRDLISGFHDRSVRPAGSSTVAGHLLKTYVIEAPGRAVTDQDLQTGLEVAAAHLASAELRGSAGLAVLIFHAGANGDYLLVHTWIEDHMSDLAVFVGRAGEPTTLRPGRAGIAPCVWEAAVLAHERDAFSRNVLDGQGAIEERLASWRKDLITGSIR